MSPPYQCQPPGHVVHFYDDEPAFHESVADFIGVGPESDDTAAVVATVADTGIGIPREFVPHVLERFRQADGSTSSMAVESEGSGQGATFSIVLPLRAVRVDGEETSGAPVAQSGPKDGAPLRLQGLDVLVVEDEEDAREFVGALLESRGASVRLAASAAEAYVSLDQGAPDVIVSDIGMPDEDGYAFARRLRTFPRERGGATPIVALTAYASAHDRRRAIEAGYDYHLSKPVDTEELIRVLDRLARAPSPRA